MVFRFNRAFIKIFTIAILYLVFKIWLHVYVGVLWSFKEDFWWFTMTTITLNSYYVVKHLIGVDLSLEQIRGDVMWLKLNAEKDRNKAIQKMIEEYIDKKKPLDK